MPKHAALSSASNSWKPKNVPLLARLALILPVAFLLFLHGLDQMGLIGPDEPRYAWIGRDMARSGDWVTPRLYGTPWFEKSPFLYWTTAAGFGLGLSDDLAPRLPVGLMSLAALAGFFLLLRERCGVSAAAYSTAILGTSAGWLAYSHIAVTDLPLTAAFAMAMLLCAEWLENGNPRRLPLAGVMLGIALLAKGLVGLVFCAPLFWLGRRLWRHWWRLIMPALITGLPWYLICYARNGQPFWDEFIVKHHFQRFFTPDLAHVQPFWYYLPVLLAGLFPWTFLVGLLRRPESSTERLLWWWLGFGLLFLSRSVNKLPGYALPLLPALAALAGIGLTRVRSYRWALVLSGALVALIPGVAEVLPTAVEVGLRRATFTWTPLILAPVSALGVWLAAQWRGRAAAFLTAAVLFVAGFLVVRGRVSQQLDGQVSARQRYQAAGAPASEICLADQRRGFRYGASYYASALLPDCEIEPRPRRISGRTPQTH